MSYILYTSIARAGGLDLLLGLESYAHAPFHPLVRRPEANGLSRLRWRAGLALIRLGEGLARRGRRWAAPLAAGDLGFDFRATAEGGRQPLRQAIQRMRNWRSHAAIAAS